jgi:hypothetical protein
MTREGLSMTTTIEDHRMTTEVDGAVIATAIRVSTDRWTVSTCPGYLTRNQAITALTIADRLAAGYDDHDPFIVAWRAELR